MCVITVKPRNIIIDYSTVQNMWLKNPDGCGLAYFDSDGRVLVEKGFMTLPEAWTAINRHQDKELVIHFRLATHGKKTPQQTHPFAITKNIVDAKAYYCGGAFKAVLFHNGIITNYGNEKYSDTLEFIVCTLAEIPKLRTKLDVLELTENKYALLTKGKIYLIGDFHKHKGLTCSNLYFLPQPVFRNVKYSSSGTPWYKNYLYDPQTIKTIEEENLEEDCFTWLAQQKPKII